MSKEEEIVAMYKEGFGADRISDALDVSRDKVYDTLKKHNIPRRPSGSYSYVHEWRPLRRKTKSKGKKGNLRVVTIPVRLIERAGYDPDDELEGKWEAKRGRLILYMREVGGSGLSSKLKRKMLGGGRE